MNYRKMAKRVCVADDLDFSQESIEADEYLMDLYKEEAEEKGVRKEKRNTARNMLKRKCDVNFISEVTGLSKKQIANIKF